MIGGGWVDVWPLKESRERGLGGRGGGEGEVNFAAFHFSSGNRDGVRTV